MFSTWGRGKKEPKPRTSKKKSTLPLLPRVPSTFNILFNPNSSSQIQSSRTSKALPSTVYSFRLENNKLVKRSSTSFSRTSDSKSASNVSLTPTLLRSSARESIPATSSNFVKVPLLAYLRRDSDESSAPIRNFPGPVPFIAKNYSKEVLQPPSTISSMPTKQPIVLPHKSATSMNLQARDVEEVYYASSSSSSSYSSSDESELQLPVVRLRNLNPRPPISILKKPAAPVPVFYKFQEYLDAREQERVQALNQMRKMTVALPNTTFSGLPFIVPASATTSKPNNDNDPQVSKSARARFIRGRSMIPERQVVFDSLMEDSARKSPILRIDESVVINPPAPPNKSGSWMKSVQPLTKDEIHRKIAGTLTNEEEKAFGERWNLNQHSVQMASKISHKNDKIPPITDETVKKQIRRSIQDTTWRKFDRVLKDDFTKKGPIVPKVDHEEEQAEEDDGHGSLLSQVYHFCEFCHTYILLSLLDGHYKVCTKTSALDCFNKPVTVQKIQTKSPSSLFRPPEAQSPVLSETDQRARGILKKVHFPKKKGKMVTTIVYETSKTKLRKY